MLDVFCYRTHDTELESKVFFFCCINQCYPKWGRPPVGSTETKDHIYYISIIRALVGQKNQVL